MLARVLLVSAITWWASPQIAHADPPGPTDYETRIVSVTPDVTDVATITIEGSDAFVQLSVTTGHEVEVPGYHDEPYLRVDADGRVWENRRSGSYFYNQERFGGDRPDDFDDDTPEWVEVADDGVYAWHDHRAHWMSEIPLVGLRPGDALPPETIPLIVDGQPVEVVVETVLQPEPSMFPLLAGALIGAVLLVAASFRPVVVSLVTGAAAMGIGIGQYLSVPTVTGPSWSWVALPAVALVCALAAIVVGHDHFSRPAWVAGTGVGLVVWAYQRVDIATAAFVPNALGGPVDRATSLACAIAGFGLLIVGSYRLLVRPSSSVPTG